MRFEQLMTFWKLQPDMIKHQSCMTNDAIHESRARHCTYMMSVGNGNMHANIMYKFQILDGKKIKFAMIHADIMFSDWAHYDGKDSKLFIPNASIARVAEYIK